MLAGQFLATMQSLAAFKIEMFEARASPKQLAVQEDFLARRHRTYAVLGGNRSGKTVTNGALCFGKWLRDVARDGDLYWVVSPSSEKSVTGPQKFLYEEVLPRGMFIKPFDQKNGFDGQRPIIELVLPNGRGKCVINFKNCEQAATTFESDKINGAWISESIPYEYYTRILPRTVDKAAWILYDDIPEQDWHYFELLHAPVAARVYCVILSSYDNQPNLPPGEVDLLAARLTDKDERDMRIWGKFRRLSGVVIKTYDRDRHRIRPFPIPSDGPYPSLTHWPRWRLLDIGGSAPTACLWITLAPNERAYVYREFYQRNATVSSAARAIKQMSRLADGRQELYTANLMDPAAWQTSHTNELCVAELYDLEGLHFGKWPYMNVFGEHAAVEILKKRFEVDQLFIFDTCVELDRELCAWKYQCDRDGNPKAADQFENRNNHAIDGAKGFFATWPTFTQQQIRVRGGEDRSGAEEDYDLAT